MKRVSLVATVLALGAALVGVSQPAELSGEAGRPAPAAQGTSVPAGCHEEDPCWNSCTMGVDGRFPPTDPRHYVPGPCDLSATLPHGRFFRVEVSPTSYAVECGPGWAYSRVDVIVYESDGVSRVSSVDALACVPNGEDALSDDVGGLLPGMYRQAAQGV